MVKPAKALAVLAEASATRQATELDDSDSDEEMSGVSLPSQSSKRHRAKAKDRSEEDSSKKTLPNRNSPLQKRTHDDRDEEMKERFAKAKRLKGGPVDLKTMEKDPVMREWMGENNAEQDGDDDDDDDDDHDDDEDKSETSNSSHSQESSDGDDLEAEKQESMPNHTKKRKSMPNQSDKPVLMLKKSNKKHKSMPVQNEKVELVPEQSKKQPVSRLTDVAIPEATTNQCGNDAVEKSPGLLIPVACSDYLPLLSENRYWNGNLEQCYQWFKLQGELNPAFIRKRDAELANWIAEQQDQFSKDLLPKEKINRLLKAGFKLKEEEESDESWLRNLHELKKFLSTHSHTDVPEDTELGKWVHRQRMKGYHDRLTPERKIRLEASYFKFDPSYMLPPAYAQMTLPDLIPDKFDPSYMLPPAYAQMTLPDVIPDKGCKFRLCRVVYFVFEGAIVIIVMWFMLAVAVGLHMGRLILRGELDVPKVHGILRDHSS